MASVLTREQLGELRRKLEGERDRLLRVLRVDPARIEADQETEFEEAAQRATERSHDLEVETRERALLAEVERALAKLADGRYGVSETTGEPIPYARLAAVPWARTGVEE